MAYGTFRGIGDFVEAVHFTAASTIRKSKNDQSTPPNLAATLNLGKTVRFREHFSH
jgi:hypothetical protein